MPTEIGASYLLLVTLSVMCVMFTGKEHGEALGIAMCTVSVIMQAGVTGGVTASVMMQARCLLWLAGPLHATPWSGPRLREGIP